MGGKYMELRPDKELLNPHFKGYKLSLQPLHSLSRLLITPVDKVKANEDQYSFVHTKLFALHNHLINDPWDEYAVYFIDQQWHVQKGCFYTDCGLTELVKVWEVPAHRPRVSGHYNLSLVFASDTVAVLSDGAGTLHVIDTALRGTNGAWRSLFCDEIIGPETSFIVVDARCAKTKKNLRVLNVILMHIENVNGSTDTVLNWVTLSESVDGAWGAIALRNLRAKGDLYYCSLEKGCEALYIAGQNQFKFISDSENKIVKKQAQKPKLYLWQQTSDGITITFNIDKPLENSDISVERGNFDLKVLIKNQEIINSRLWKPIDGARTAWSITDTKLEITLFKEEKDLKWDQLMAVGDGSGEEILDPKFVDEAHQRLAHLCSDKEETGASMPSFSSHELEECDVSVESSTLQRIECVSHEATHTVGLGGYPILFTIHLEAGQPPAIVVRHDVDACVWQPLVASSDADVFKHAGTLLAFGYVQASKQLKKFSVCSPDMSYAVIAESSRHLFIYRQNREVDDGCELRNRGTSHRVNNIAEQQIITLPPDEILGIRASNNILYVLKSKELIYFEL